MGAKLALVMALATGISLKLVTAETADERIAAQQQATTRAEHLVAQVGMATLGSVYLATPDEGTVTLKSETLRALEKGLDPALKTGGFYPIRKGVEQLAGWLAFILFAASGLQAMFAGGADGSRVTQWVTTFFIVWLLMWFYPTWDLIVYKSMAQPIAEQLHHGPIVDDVVKAVRNQNTTGVIDPGLGTSSPTEELSSFQQYEIACTLEIAQATKSDPSAAEKCFGDDVPLSRQAAYAQALRTNMGGTAAEQEAYIETLDPKLTERIRMGWESVRAAGRRVVEAAEDLNQTIGNIVVGAIDRAISSTLSGIVTGLVNIIGSAVLWFVWLATIAARAVSFAFAPMAIVWSLAPGRGLDSAKKWFVKHAEISFWPVGLAFGLLMFYAMQTAILSTPMVSGEKPQGLAVKVCLFIGFCFTAFKSGSLTKLMAGDVGEFAADMGKSVATRTVQFTASAAKLGLVAATGGAAAGAMGAASAAGAGAASGAGAAAGAGAGAAAKVGGASALTKGITSLGSKSGMFSQSGGLAGKLGMGSSSPVGVKGRLQWLGKGAISGAKVATRGAAKGAKWAYDNRVKSSEVEAGLPSIGRSAVVTPIDEAYKDYKTRMGQRVAATDNQTADNLNKAAENLAERTQLLQKYGVDKPSARAGEAIAIDTRQISMADRGADASKDLAQKLIAGLVQNGIPLQVNASINGSTRSYSLAPESAHAITELMQRDPQIAGDIERLAKERYGSSKDVPRVAGENGSVIDVNALMRDSDGMANAAAAAAQFSELREAEVARRELLSAKLGLERDSALEIAVRSLDPELAVPQPGETDVAFSNRVQEFGRMALRPAVGREQGDDVMEWEEEGSFAKLSADEEAVLRGNLRVLAADYQEKRSRTVRRGGKVFGLDFAEYVKSAGRTQQYAGHKNSLYEEIRQRPDFSGDDEAAYKLAIDEVRDHLPTKAADESDQEFQSRLQVRINELVFLSAVQAKP